MTDTRSGPADNGSNTRYPSLDCSRSMTERRLRVLSLLTEKTLWKKRVSEKLGESPQTIGRDVHALQADGLLAPEFVSPGDVNRHHIIAFRTTSEGKSVLDDYRVCENCGEVVDTRRDCLHDYAPLDEAVDVSGGEF